MKLLYKKILISVSLLLFFSISILPVHADIFSEIGKNLTDFNQGAQLPVASEPLDIVINIINVILSLLGLFFIIMVIYGGFTYMTAGGAQDKAKKALGIIKDAAIGVAIILVSAALVNYVIKQIVEKIIT
ncbi:MAG TPA: hypothetical protein PKZ16_00340 [bacterium]|nr:hypothetical protein [bacterium]HPL95864.1 hypothetical protein [bacterium]